MIEITRNWEMTGTFLPNPMDGEGTQFVPGRRQAGLLSLSNVSNILAHCWDVLEVSTIFLSGLWASPLLLLGAQIQA